MKEEDDRLRVKVDDEARLTELRTYQILDRKPEGQYEQLVEMIEACCGGAWTAVSFVDRYRQWFKARRGFTENETLRSVGFCSVAMHQNEPLRVENSLLDGRFRENALAKEHGLRFYAGFPIFSRDGYGLGSVCIPINDRAHLRPRNLPYWKRRGTG